MRVPQVNERMKEAPAHALRAMFAGIGQLLSVTDKLRGKATAEPEPKNEAAETAAPSATAPEAAEAQTPAAGPAPESVAAQPAAPETIATESAAAQPAAPETAASESAAAEPTAPETAGAGGASDGKPKAAAKPAVAKPKAAAKPAAVTPDASAAAGGHVKLLPPGAVPAEETVTAPAAATAGEPAATAEAAPAAPVMPAAATAGGAPAADLPLANYDDLTVASLRARLRNLSADQLTQLIDYEKGHAARTDVITMFERRIAKLAEG